MTKSETKFTPGPWSWHQCFDPTGKHITSLDITFPGGHSLSGVAVIASVWSASEANARLIAAAPELYDGCNAMLGLIQLIQGRDDLSAELREVLATNHRIAEAEKATAKARGDQ